MDQESFIQSRYNGSLDYFFKQRLVLVFIFGFVGGVVLSSFVFIRPLWSLYFIFLALSALLAERIWHKRIDATALGVLIAVVAISAGSLRYEIKDFYVPDYALEARVGTKVEIVGMVVREPELRENTTRVLVKSESTKVLASADLYANIKYGDTVKVSGKLGKPGKIDDGSGRPFDYAAYLSKDDIYYTLSFAEVEVLSSGSGNRVKRVLFGVKRSFVERVKSILPEPEASLLAGLIVSGKEAMPKEILEEFRRSGVVHIVVLSGYNVAIIAEAMRKSLEKTLLGTRLPFGPKLSAGASIIGILLFVLMTGAEATVVRAALMVLVVIAAKLFGRNYSAPRALIGAAFLMVLHNPKILIYDPSFQLSFLATSALIYVVPIVERYLSKVPERWGIRGVLATTLSTQTVVLPYLIYAMGEVSLVALPANMLILLIIPLTMLAGFASAGLSYLNLLLAMPLAYVAHVLLAWILGVSSVFGNLSYASVAIKSFPSWALILSYLLMIFLVFTYNRVRIRKSAPGDSGALRLNVR
jgi:competence protein ComEC